MQCTVSFNILYSSNSFSFAFIGPLSLFYFSSHISLYQASINGLCDGTRRSVCLSVGLSYCNVYCSKTAQWIRLLFGILIGVGQGMGVLDGVVIVEGKGQFWW